MRSRSDRRTLRSYRVLDQVSYFSFSAYFSFVLVLSCTAAPTSKAPAPSPAAATQGAAAPAAAAAAATTKTYAPELVSRGMRVYRSNCIACHNLDPNKPGSQGPDVFGSSLELLEARVLSLKYPPGYKPKRMTKLMRPMPMIKKDLPALEAYLNTPIVK